MNTDHSNSNVIDHPAKDKRTKSSTERIWGKNVYKYGYVGVPSILIQGQKRLGLNQTQLNIIIHLLDYWYDPLRKPFPRKKELAQRIGVTEKTLQNNMKLLEDKGYLSRERRKTAAGDWNSNLYHLDGLIQAVQALEPEFTAEKKRRKAGQEAVRTPEWLRDSA